MSKKELVAQQLETIPEKDLDVVLGLIQSLKSKRAEDVLPALAAESSLAKDWLTPEEEAAWADL